MFLWTRCRPSRRLVSGDSRQIFRTCFAWDTRETLPRQIASDPLGYTSQGITFCCLSKNAWKGSKKKSVSSNNFFLKIKNFSFYLIMMLLILISSCRICSFNIVENFKNVLILGLFLDTKYFLSLLISPVLASPRMKSASKWNTWLTALIFSLKLPSEKLD